MHNKKIWLVLGVVFCAPAFGQETGETNDPYQRCAVCHLQNGEGVVGAFPPLAGHITQFFDTQKGRDYLVQIIIHGMQGQIRVGAQTYFGVMPAIVADLNDAEMLALLNRLVEKFATPQQKATHAKTPFFTQAAIAYIRQNPIKDPALQGLRQSVLNIKTNDPPCPRTP